MKTHSGETIVQFRNICPTCGHVLAIHIATIFGNDPVSLTNLYLEEDNFSYLSFPSTFIIDMKKTNQDFFLSTLLSIHLYSWHRVRALFSNYISLPIFCPNVTKKSPLLYHLRKWGWRRFAYKGGKVVYDCISKLFVSLGRFSPWPILGKYSGAIY